MSTDLRIEHGPESLRLYRPGLAAPLLVQHAAPDKRPFIHPLRAPDGIGELTENEPGHHLWQHGLYVGLNDVNGAGFWTEGLHEKHKASDGTFHPQPLAAPRADGRRAAWQVRSAWRAPGGAPLLAETQSWRFEDAGAHLLLDLDWTLAAETDLRFGAYPYGGLFLRVPYRQEAGGTALNSAGLRNAEAEGRRARWVSVHLPLPGREASAAREAGLAILDHPSNPEHPAPWRVDGQLGVAPSRCISGAWMLARGQATVSKYRLFVFTGPADPARVEAQWQAFAGVR